MTESAAVDAAKEAAENERLVLIQEEIAKAEKEAEDLEQLRWARELRIPPTPEGALPRAVLSVGHVQLGTVTKQNFEIKTNVSYSFHFRFARFYAALSLPVFYARKFGSFS